jgi:hypothetical protein
MSRRSGEDRQAKDASAHEVPVEKMTARSRIRQELSTLVAADMLKMLQARPSLPERKAA